METQFKYATATYATCLKTYKIGDRIPWKELAAKGWSRDFSDDEALECSSRAQKEGDFVIESGLPTTCDRCPPIPTDSPLLAAGPLEADIVFKDYQIVGVRRVYRIDTPVNIEWHRLWRIELEALKQRPFEPELWHAAAERTKAKVTEWRRLRRKTV
jgi:hypothetical protein